MNRCAGVLTLTKNQLKDLEQDQSKRALDRSLKGGFSLRKKPLEGIAFGYSYSDFAIARDSGQGEHTQTKGLRSANSLIEAPFFK